MTAEKVTQRQFMEATGVRYQDLPAIREKYLSKGEWWKEGVTIFWDKAAAYRVKAILEAEKQQPTPQADEQNEEGQPGIQVQPEAPLPLPEVPVGEETQPDLGDVGGDTEPVGTAETEAETTLIARVLKRARNYRYVYASLDGERIAVFCPKKGRQNIVGKNVRISKSTVDGETRYTLIP